MGKAQSWANTAEGCSTPRKGKLLRTSSSKVLWKPRATSYRVYCQVTWQPTEQTQFVQFVFWTPLLPILLLFQVQETIREWILTHTFFLLALITPQHGKSLLGKVVLCSCRRRFRRRGTKTLLFPTANRHPTCAPCKRGFLGSVGIRKIYTAELFRGGLVCRD